MPIQAPFFNQDECYSIYDLMEITRLEGLTYPFIGCDATRGIASGYSDGLPTGATEGGVSEP